MSATNKAILVFPGGMPRSLAFLDENLRDGKTVIGASSLAYDAAKEQYPAWLHLPFISQPDFDEHFRKAVQEFGIGSVFTPNPVVWNYLERKLHELAPGVVLLNQAPAQHEMLPYRTAVMHARALLDRPLQLAACTAQCAALSEIELAALFRHAETIPGMCDHEKRAALCEIARHAMQGDIVEIGSWWGKSAFILARLAHCHDIGKLLCVDPWSNQHLAQHDANDLVDRVSAQTDAGEALRIFEMNLLPYSDDRVNYLRLPSVDGAQHYRTHASVTTAAFGTTQYCGRIAILHIDGNHHYDAIKADVAAWCDLVIAGGWIIIDDYIWPYGDGPQCIGDAFLIRHRREIAVSFVIGSALFIQLAEKIPADHLRDAAHSEA